MNYLRKDGWVCSRSAMSHGPVDVFAARSGKILLIQVKSGSARVKKEELELLVSYAREFKAEAQVWSFKKRGIIHKVTVNNRLVSKANHKEPELKPESPKQPIVADISSAPIQLAKAITPPS
jgi:Holliday junction resolvase